MVQFYNPEALFLRSILYALVHAPDTGGCTSLSPEEWTDPESRFFDANGRRIPEPPLEDMDFFVDQPHVYADYFRYKSGNQVALGSEHCEATYRKLGNIVQTDLETREATVTFDDSYGRPAKNGVALYYWHDPSCSQSSGEPCDGQNQAMVSYDDCWSDSHSKFFSTNGTQTPRAPDDTQGDYEMAAVHLTLLKQKSSGKTVGGYWWGEFRHY